MTLPELDDVERIARSVEWDPQTPWELDEGLSTGADSSLAAAKRYMAAQSFLLSWQEGRVPVGWQRARRLADYDGEYPPRVVDAALDRINELITERNEAANARIARVAQERRVDEQRGAANTRGVSKAEVAAVNAQFAAFNNTLIEMKGAVAKASSAVEKFAIRVQALQEKA